MKTNKILVLTELDDQSTRLTWYAVDLARKMDVKEIILLNIIIPAHTQAFTATGDVFPAEADLSVHMDQIIREKHQQRIETEARRFSDPQVKVKPFVRYSDSKTHLNHFMEEFGAALVVCCSRNEPDFIEKVFGSQTHKLARRVDYPVIILKKETPVEPIENIVVAIDIENEEQEGLERIKEFARAIDARLHYLYILIDQKFTASQAREKLRQLSGNQPEETIHVIQSDDLENGMNEYTRKYQPDMVAVLSQGKGKISRFIYGSGSEEIIEETNKPVLLSKMH
ncbi:MAG: universal stress protein [Bacteroidales bacterium]